MLKRVSIKKEPILKVHRYIVTIGSPKNQDWHTKFFYCANLKEVQLLKEGLTRGQYIEVFEAKHDFREAWYKE